MSIKVYSISDDPVDHNELWEASVPVNQLINRPYTIILQHKGIIYHSKLYQYLAIDLQSKSLMPEFVSTVCITTFHFWLYVLRTIVPHFSGTLYLLHIFRQLRSELYRVEKLCIINHRNRIKILLPFSPRPLPFNGSPPLKPFSKNSAAVGCSPTRKTSQFASTASDTIVPVQSFRPNGWRKKFYN